MTEITPPINTIATDADLVIKTLENILVPIAQNAIIAQVPALGLPVVKQITDAIEQALADRLTKLAETGVTFQIIDFQGYAEVGSLSDALRAYLAAKKSGDQNAINQALANLQKAQSALVSDDGSAQPQ